MSQVGRVGPVEVLKERWDLLLVIAAGGALGSLARYGLAEAFPHQDDEIAWGTVLANLTGAFGLGVLVVLVLEVWPERRYLRPFLGVGVLGGYTTFSTYVLDTRGLLAAGAAPTALLYVFGTLVLGLAAVWAGLTAARVGVRRSRGGRR